MQVWEEGEVSVTLCLKFIYIYIQVLIIFSFVLITSSCFYDGSLLPFGILGCFMCMLLFFHFGAKLSRFIQLCLAVQNSGLHCVSTC